MGTGTYPAVQTLTVTFTDQQQFSGNWVFDSRCTTCGAGTLFNKSKSSSYKLLSNGFSTDRVCLNLAATTCTDKTFKFTLAESDYGNKALQVPFAGLFDLSPRSESDRHQNLIRALYSANAITDPVFALLIGAE